MNREERRAQARAKKARPRRPSSVPDAGAQTFKQTRSTVTLTEPGEVGYCMERTDQCLQAAIATAIQVPIEQLPDLRLDQRVVRGEPTDEVNRTSWARMGAWLAKRGLALQFHEQVPVHRHRWVGVITAGPLGDEDIDYLVNLLGVTREVIEGREYFNDHCLVMSYDRLVFDPSIGITPPPGLAVREWDPDEITYGISFDKKED